MPDKRKTSNELTVLFAQYGIESFLESTSLLVVLLEKDGELLSWNPAFDSLKETLPDKTHLKDFLSSSSADTFEALFMDAKRERARARGNLEFAHGNRSGSLACLFVPLPGKRVLFIAEPSAANDLEAVAAELQTTKQRLQRKETELKAVIAQANEVSHTDPLTYLPNRRQIIGDLQREVIFAEQYGTPFAISLLDIDHFKKINDIYGHTVGDEVLRKLADELRQHIRHPDTIGRYGGEEFLLILPHSTVIAATEQAERLCKYVRSLVIRAGEHDISLTISMGVAQYKIRREDWNTFLSRADKALYQAKNNGRDQWAVAEK
ncbi:MAG: GGDEF domain-containing protein [Anaerolineae bacterium]|nr:GGDEF domain-containing protein [Anaerolineae bacterium]MCI0607612.1 GGDEF domain-containing protein [Anaerolineae bacterium]